MRCAVLECVQNVLTTTPIEFFFPVGTAIQNARGTSLDSIGAQEHLTADSNGHLQEGLPVLLASYVTALKLMELNGESSISVMGEKTRPTKSWITDRNTPGWNPATGTIATVTESDYLIAQKCAVAAIKFPTSVTTIAE